MPAGTIIDWAEIEPFVAHVPTARLRIPYRKLGRLHPAQIADLVEAASHEEGEEIIKAVGQDRELEADVFEELDEEHQLEFIHSRSDSEAAQLLATMAADDAADLIIELEQDRRLPVLQLMPTNKQRKIRTLLSYNPETAGGLMSPDFLCVAETDAGAQRPRRHPPFAGTPRGPVIGVRMRQRRPCHRDGLGGTAGASQSFGPVLGGHAAGISSRPSRLGHSFRGAKDVGLQFDRGPGDG